MTGALLTGTTILVILSAAKDLMLTTRMVSIRSFVKFTLERGEEPG